MPQSKTTELEIGNKVADLYGGAFRTQENEESRIDGVVWADYNNELRRVALVEVKDRTAGPRPISSTKYDTYMISKRKYMACYTAACVFGVDFIIGVRFTDGDFYCRTYPIGSAQFEQFCSVAMGGRSDRGRKNDREQCVYINIARCFRPLDERPVEG